MVSDHYIDDREEVTVCTLSTPNCRFSAHPFQPFIAAGRLVALLTCTCTLESSGIYVFPPPKERAKESDLCILRRPFRDKYLVVPRRFGRHSLTQSLFTLPILDLLQDFCSAGIEPGQFFFGSNDQSIDFRGISHSHIKGSPFCVSPTIR